MDQRIKSHFANIEYLKQVYGFFTQDFLESCIDFEKIVMVENKEGLELMRAILGDALQIGVDLEGWLEKEGNVELIQLATTDIIFIVDVYTLQKNSVVKGGDSALEYQLCIDVIQEIMENEGIEKIFHDGKKDSLALHHFFGCCVVNYFDVGTMTLFVNCLKIHEKHFGHYVAKKRKKSEKEPNANGKGHPEHNKKQKNGMKTGISEETKCQMKIKPEISKEEPKKDQEKTFVAYENELKEIKCPNLNDVLKQFQAPHGENMLKDMVKNRFCTFPKSYFLQRPIDPEFYVYSAKDVEDLVSVRDNIVETIFQTFQGQVKREVVELLCKAISRQNSVYSCQKMIPEKP
jgi:hypothetical protein